jgi:hypothetical protein
MSRVTAPGASFVCSVLSTRWPVSEALNGDLRGFQVARFADHDAVRVLPEKGAQDARERQADVLVHGDLDDALHIVLHRVFRREHLRVDRVYFVKRRVKRGGLAGAGRDR